MAYVRKKPERPPLPKPKRGRGAPRTFETPQDMEDAWEAFKEDCDNQQAVTTDFSQRNAGHVTSVIRKRITYTIIGFCVFCKFAREDFYNNYTKKPEFSHIVKRIENECEFDVRRKLETGDIPSQLSGLLLSKHGYSTKSESEIKGAVPVVVSGGDELAD